MLFNMKRRFLQSFADKRVSLGDRLIFEPEYDIKTKERHLDALQRKRVTPMQQHQLMELILQSQQTCHCSQ